MSITAVDTDNIIDEKEQVEQTLPLIIAGRYTVLNDRHVSSGHFGSVYEGVDKLTGQAVAIKLSKTRISSREIRALEALEHTSAAPIYFYNGIEDEHHVIVMELMGSSLYSVIEKRSTQKRKSWVLTKLEARRVGLQCLNLLQQLHQQGFVHGDVKPANFVCLKGTSLAQIRLIDFGLSRSYINADENSAHIDYWQHLTHFAGSLRYASIHAHLGRQLSRRDDLESLAYMLLYLMQGALPWQGFRGPDKGNLICLSKGSISLTTLCTGVPCGLLYFLTYVRQLKFDLKPNYAYLRDCLNFGNVNFSPVETRPDSTSADIAAAINANETKVGSKRAAPATARNSSLDTAMLPPAFKKHRVILPTPRKIHQWVVISSQRYPKFPQRMLASASLNALIHKVNSMADNDIGSNGYAWRVQSLCAAENLFRAAMNCSSHSITEQALYRAGSDAEFLDIVRALSQKGRRITQVLGTDSGWVACASVFKNEASPAPQQRFGLSETFPTVWIDDNWQDGFQIEAIGSTSTKWAVAMTSSNAMSYDEQIVELSFSYPSEAIRARWRQGFSITEASCTAEQSAYVMSRNSSDHEIVQRCTRTSHNPSLKLKVESKQEFSIDALTFGRVE